MKIFATFVLVLPLSLLAACAVSPERVADSYRQALESGDSASIEALSSYSSDFSGALKNGYYSYAPSKNSAAADKSGEAYIESSGARYRLHNTENGWKVDCSTAGPFNQSTPEMTLLLALHLAANGRFGELRRLAPPDAVPPEGEPSEAALKLWRDFVKDFGAYDCRPFEVGGDHAVLSYGVEARRKVRMQRIQSKWYILEIN